MLDALGNIFRIPELRQKIIFTLIMFAVFRMGTHIPVPGVDPSAIEQLFAQGTLFGLLDLFSGGAFSKFSVFAMSITPYINAAIIIQLLNVVVPTLEQWSKEGAEGQKKTTKVTRYLTVALAFFQAIGMSIGLKSAILNPNPVNILIIAITLTAGTVFLMWLGEQITANGVGNGISLIIFAGIVAALPKNIGTIYAYLKAGTISYFSVFAFAVIALAMIVFVIHIETGFRRVPVTYAKRVVGGRMGAGHSSHIPFKVNQAGVIPIIFASSVLMFPITVAQFIDIPWVKTVASYLEWGKPLQTTLYVLMIIFHIPDGEEPGYGGQPPPLRRLRPRAPPRPGDCGLSGLCADPHHARGSILPRIHRRSAEHGGGGDAYSGRVLRRYGAAHRRRRCPADDEADRVHGRHAQL